uniref:Uncharacterized protein n=1 Tax=Trichuris muris TaxID=70415 RepID=A0A5S6QBU5_TRIMR
MSLVERSGRPWRFCNTETQATVVPPMARDFRLPLDIWQSITFEAVFQFTRHNSQLRGEGDYLNQNISLSGPTHLAAGAPNGGRQMTVFASPDNWSCTAVSLHAAHAAMQTDVLTLRSTRSEAFAQEGENLQMGHFSDIFGNKRFTSAAIHKPRTNKTSRHVQRFGVEQLDSGASC